MAEKDNDKDKIAGQIIGSIILIGSWLFFGYVVVTGGDPMHSIVAFAFGGVGAALYYGSESLLEHALTRKM